MEIQRTNNIQFGARYMGPAKVKSKVGTKWKDLEVSFIKFETVKQEDRKVLSNICRLWNRKNLSAGIAEEANILGSNAQIYALSKQKDFSLLQKNLFQDILTLEEHLIHKLEEVQEDSE